MKEDAFRKLGARLERVAASRIDIKFNAELFNQRLDCVLVAMRCGELPVPKTKEEYRLLISSLMPGCVTSVR